MNPETNKSKGYAFIEFINYKEFQQALNISEPVIFGQQKLVFNSAKKRYDNNDKILKNNKAYHEENKTEDFYDDNFNQNTFIKNYSFLTHNNNNSNIRISGISGGNTINTSINSCNISPFQGEKNKLKKTENNILNDNSTHSQIKYALKNMANCYSSNPYFLKSKICSYYCMPFFNKDFFDSKKD